MRTIDSLAFIARVFNRIELDEYPIVVAHDSRTGAWTPHLPMMWMKGPHVLSRPIALYFSVAAHRIADGALPKRGKAYFSSAHCVVLDDVGSKVPVPPAEPSWVMETSPGNYQYGYMIHRYDNALAYERAMHEIARAGWTDAGSIDCVHLFRLPGSYHVRTGTRAKLVRWHGRRRYLLKNLLKRLDIDPDVLSLPEQVRWKPPESEAPSTEMVEADPTWRFLKEHSVALAPPNQSGWAPIICPWHENHTDRSLTEARYLPGKQSFHCFHESCSDMTSRDFLEWVELERKAIASQSKE